MEAQLRKQTEELGLSDKINFLGSMNPAKVLKNMSSADIFLMTSSCQEGWGAVANEAMSTGCVVLGSSEAGSIPFLIKDGENGLIYKYGNQKDFCKKLERLVADVSYRRKLSTEAFRTIKDEYNQTVAVKRLMEFIDDGCKDADYKSGPMSKATVTKNEWYK